MFGHVYRFSFEVQKLFGSPGQVPFLSFINRFFVLFHTRWEGFSMAHPDDSCDQQDNRAQVKSEYTDSSDIPDHD
jgi:hypothetical protein